MLVLGLVAIILTTVIGITFPLSIVNSYQHLDQSLHFDESTLVLSHVIFRHGNRTIDGGHELYPKDPYINETYFPYGLGQLTNAGKKKEYSIGAALRKRYNQFLGKFYYPDVVEAHSTDYDRTKMSLQLVLAGLFPPNAEQMFEDNLRWQPIPFQYQSRDQDKILVGVNCKKYIELYEEISNSIEIQREFHKYRNTFNYISENTGLNITRFLDVYNLYFGLATEVEWGFQLPAWTKSLWPETITALAIKDYFVAIANPEMSRMASGYLLKKIIEDTKNKLKSKEEPGRKLYLYSGHENNIAQLLIVLGLFEPHIPNYGAYLLLEIHRIDELYGVKIYYENYTKEGPQLLKIPNCDEFCHLEKFINLVQNVLPPDDLCGI